MPNQAQIANSVAHDNRSGSRGQRVRRLDTLLDQLRKQKEKSSDPRALLYTAELESFRKEARYCFLDAGPGVQGALQQLNAIDFTVGRGLDAEAQRGRHDGIDLSKCNVFDAESERQCIDKLDQLIGLVEKVRKTEETSAEIEPTMAPLSPGATEGKTFTVLRDLDTLLKLKSLSQSQAAEALGISARAVRGLVQKEQLSKAAKGRIVCDAKFIEQFNSRHSPAKK